MFISFLSFLKWLYSTVIIWLTLIVGVYIGDIAYDIKRANPILAITPQKLNEDMYLTKMDYDKQTRTLTFFIDYREHFDNDVEDIESNMSRDYEVRESACREIKHKKFQDITVIIYIFRDENNKKVELRISKSECDNKGVE